MTVLSPMGPGIWFRGSVQVLRVMVRWARVNQRVARSHQRVLWVGVIVFLWCMAGCCLGVFLFVWAIEKGWCWANRGVVGLF